MKNEMANNMEVFRERSLLLQNFDEELEILDVSKVYSIGYTINYKILSDVYAGYYSYTVYPSDPNWKDKLWKTIKEKINWL